MPAGHKTRMKQEEAEELIALLPEGRTLFTYGKDWYAVALLAMGLRHSDSEKIRKTSLGRLFHKPQIKLWMGMLGKRAFSGEDLTMLWPEETETYRLTADVFDGWAQTTRKGKAGWNIVLQLNLNVGDARWMEKKFPDRDDDPFECSWHPIHTGRHRTLAWCRIDLDWETGEALIEEIQNDRLREVGESVERIRKKGLKTIELCGRELDAKFVIRYWEERLRLSRHWWDEAMLCAAMQFIVGELGIRNIYYHSPLSGARLKGVRNAPTSLYSDLPRKFCFEKTEDLPKFVKTPRKGFLNGMWMHRLCL